MEKSSHNVAKRFKIKDRGFLREGYFADITCVDLDKSYTVMDNILYKCGWSPLENKTLRSSIINCYKNKVPIYELISGASIAFAALLLIIPGFFTDFLGFLLLIPLSRNFLFKFFFKSSTLANYEKIFYDFNFFFLQALVPIHSILGSFRLNL